MSKNTKFLCCLTTFTALTVVCLGAAGLDDEAQVEYDEHLFIAGNDSTGTASITYASRINPHPITIRFENFSYPDSCAFHPSRCRNLTYLSSPTNDNHTQLIFYVPLMKSALGVMEFVHNRTALSHVQTRAVDVPGQCIPISMINFFGALRLLCLVPRGQEDFIKLCKVKNAASVKGIWLSCSTPEYPINLVRLSNFIVYGNRAIDAYIYFTYQNAMYAKVPSSGRVSILAYLPLEYSYCRHLDFVNSSKPLIVSYCYTNANHIQVVYFDLYREYFLEQNNASRVVSYHCPSPETFVEVAIGGAFASFWQGRRPRGSFNIIGHSVLFARCFEFGSSLHFLYNDERLGTFIKPHISKNLRETVEQLSLQGCANPACEQPLIFNNKYILLLLENSALRNWTLRLIDIERGWNNSLLTFNSSSTSQLALISNFEHVPMATPLDSVTTTNPGINSNSATVIGTSVTLSTVVLVVITVAVLLLIFYFIKQSHRKRERRAYSFVPANPSNSRQQSPMDKELEMDNLSTDQNHEEQSTSSASSTTECVANHNDLEDTVCFNPNNHGENSEPVDLNRENYGVIGSSRSMEDVQRLGSSVVTTQQPPPPPPGQTSTATQGNATSTPQQSADSAQTLPHSNDRTVNSTNSGSVSIPARSQAIRPQSLTPNQHSQASPTSAPPPPTNYSTVQCPSRMNSTESNASHTSHSSDGRVSNATTPAGLPLSANGTPSSPMVYLTAATMYAASQTSLQYDGSGQGLPLNRSAYVAVGCSQEDVQQPYQCTQQPAVGQMSGNSMGYNATSNTSTTPQPQYGSAMGYTGSYSNSTSSTPQQQYPSNPPFLGASHSTVPRLDSQWSNDSTGSGTGSIPENSITANHMFHSRHQSLTPTPPFVHDNQVTDLNISGHFSANQPTTLNRMDSNTSQNSGVGMHVPLSDHPTPTFFPSDTNQIHSGIYPPSPMTLQPAQYATDYV